MDYHKAIYLFLMFGFNDGVSVNFVRKVFGNHYDEYMLRHLEEKFETMYDRYGWRASFFYFWSELDTNNKHILEDWIMENYRG